MLEEQYSGDRSVAFWEVVHIVDDGDDSLYMLGCQLQNLEGVVLAKLRERLQYVERLKTAANKPSAARKARPKLPKRQLRTR